MKIEGAVTDFRPEGNFHPAEVDAGRWGTGYVSTVNITFALNVFDESAIILVLQFLPEAEHKGRRGTLQ
ncbi:hypothetical protein Bpfe_013041 [Biomphalaria pfeifferi]|uniref:Uncharacterized protein n=1 Tax=Biomphalaria pfeifferi TaxID=112525 RepID=A0AAD8BMY9_BIOPF|nr:hypothetical protein Bpfe_013041 [Biomphalaria pfeifferi]